MCITLQIRAGTRAVLTADTVASGEVSCLVVSANFHTSRGVPARINLCGKQPWLSVLAYVPRAEGVFELKSTGAIFRSPTLLFRPENLQHYLIYREINPQCHPYGKDYHGHSTGTMSNNHNRDIYIALFQQSLLTALYKSS